MADITSHSGGVACGPASVEFDVAALRPPEVLQPFPEGRSSAGNRSLNRQTYLWKVGNLNPAPVSVRIAHHHDLDGGILARRSWRRARVIRGRSLSGPLSWEPSIWLEMLLEVQRVKRIFLSPCHRKHNLPD